MFAPMHWTGDFSSAGPIDRVVDAVSDPISGQPELKATPVQVTAMTILWRGLLLRQSERPPVGAGYWARAPLANGHAFELAGWEPLPCGRASSAAWVIELLEAPPTAELVIYADPGRGAFRYASLVGGRLQASLFLARDATSLPQRDRLAALLGTVIEAEPRTSLLAGQAAGSATIGDPGPTVCSCFAVGLRTLRRAISDRRLTSVAEIGAVLHAGTNCGSCIPEIRAILRAAHVGVAAARPAVASCDLGKAALCSAETAVIVMRGYGIDRRQSRRMTKGTDRDGRQQHRRSIARATGGSAGDARGRAAR